MQDAGDVKDFRDVDEVLDVGKCRIIGNVEGVWDVVYAKNAWNDPNIKDVKEL